MAAPKQDPKPQGVQVQHQFQAALNARADMHQGVEGSEKAYMALMYDVYPLLQHPMPEVRGAAAEFLTNISMDDLRREAGQGPLSGAFMASMRRGAGAAFNTISPISSEAIGADWGDRNKAARVFAEVTNSRFQPLTTGYWQGEENDKRRVTTEHQWGTLHGDAWYMDPVAASAMMEFDQEEMRYNSELAYGDIQTAKDGMRYVETSRGKFEIPTHITGPDGQVVDLADRAASIFRASRAIDPRGPGDIIGDRGIIGSMWYDYGSDTKEGWDRNVKVGNGEVWPFVPNITGNFEFDREQLFSPIFRRALAEAGGDAPVWTRVSVNAGAMAQELVEYIGVHKALGVAGRAGKRTFLGRASIDQFSNAKKLIPDRIVKPVLTAGAGATARSGAKNGVSTFLTWGWRDAANEMVLGVGQSMAEGGTINEGLLKGLNEVVLERTFAATGRVPVWLAGKTIGRGLGTRMAFFRNARVERGLEKTEALRRHKNRTMADTTRITEEMNSIYRDRAVAEWGLALYDTAFMAMGLASQQVAMEQAQREGVDWNYLSLEGKAGRIVGAINDSWPEALGNWTAMMGGASPAMAKQFGSIRGLWQLNSPDGKRMAAQTRAIAEMAKGGFLENTNVEAISDILTLNDQRVSPKEAESLLEESMGAQQGDIFDPPEQQDLLRTQTKLMQHLMSVNGLSFIEAHEQAFREMEELGALTNKGRLELLEVGDGGANDRLVEAKRSGLSIVPLNSSGRGVTYVDPVTGKSHTSSSVRSREMEMPDDLADVVDYSNWSLQERTEMEKGLRSGDPAAERLLQVARNNMQEGLQPIPLEGYKAPTGPAEQAHPAGSEQALDKALEDTGAAGKAQKSKLFRRPFEEAQQGAPEDVVVPEMTLRIARASKVGVDEPSSALGDLTPRQVAHELFQRLTPREYKATRTDRLVQRVEWRRQSDQILGTDTSDATVTSLTLQAAGIRDQALDLLHELPGMSRLGRTGTQADGMMAALANRNVELRNLFEATWGQRGLEAWDQATALASQTVALSQEVALHMASRWPHMYERLRLVYRANELLNTTGELPSWMLRRLRRLQLLEESSDGYALRPGVIEGLVGEFQLWTRVFEESSQATDLGNLLGGFDVVRAVTGWAHADKPIPTAMLERSMAQVPGARGEPLVGAWERMVNHLHPRSWPDSLTKWMPWKDQVLRRTNTWGRAYGLGRSREATEGAEEAIRIEQITTADMLDIRDRMTQIGQLMSEYLRRPGVTGDHSRLLVMMIHKGVFKVVRSRADFVRRYSKMLGPNSGALYEIGQQYVSLTDEMGQRLVDLGMLKPEQFEKWRGRYIHRPILETDPFLYSESQRLGPSDNWQQLDQLLSRSSAEPSVMRLMDFTLIAPLGVMREAATIRWVETLYNMWSSDRKVLVRRGDVPEAVLRRDYVHLIDHGNLPEDFPFEDSYVSKGMFDLLQQLRKNLEPALTPTGEKVPDGDLIKRERKKRGVPEDTWLGLGSSDPQSPWFENTPHAALDPNSREGNVAGHGLRYPRTENFTRFLDSLMEHEKAPNGDLVPAWFVDTNTMEMIHHMVNDAFRDSDPWQRTVQETVTVFRRMKTIYSPKHWIKNFTSSLVLNWTAGGVSPVDFVMGMVFKTGDHYEANRLLGIWKDSHNPERLARYEGDRQSMLKEWNSKDRHDLRLVENYLALSGGTTLTGSVLDPTTTENLVDSMIQGEVRLEDILPDGALSSKAFTLLNHQLQRFTEERSLGAKAQAALFSAGTRKEMARALHSVVTEYASTEHFFKLAQALHYRRKRNLAWDDAVRMGARGTADYAGVSQVVNDMTSNWRGLFKRKEARGFEEAKKRIDQTVARKVGGGAKSFMRFYVGNVFWMFNAGALPTQFRGALTHPHRALAGTALASMAVHGIMKALQSDNEEDRVREALLEMYGMEQWSLLSEEELNDILDDLAALTGGASVSFAGGEYRDEVVTVMRRLLSTQPFRGVSIPRGGRSRTLDTGDMAPLAVSMALNAANDIGSLVRGNFPEGAERKAFLQGFLPTSIKGSIGWFYDLVKNHRGETPGEHGMRAALSLSRQFGAAIHPVMALAAPETVRMVEAMAGRSMYDMTRGIRTPDWEEMALGSRLMDVALSEGLVTRAVHSFAKDVDERELILVQRLVENLMPDLRSNVQGTAAEKKLSRAMRNSMEQMVKQARSAYLDHYYLSTALDMGQVVTFDQVLHNQFGITRDMVFTGVDATMGPAVTTEMGRFISGAYAEDPEYGWMVHAASTRMVRDYIFGSKRFYPLLELARQRLMDPSVFERLFKGLIDSSGSDTVKYLHARVVEGDPGRNLRAYYAVFKTLNLKQIRGILGKRQARELYEAFAANGMLGDPGAPDMETLKDALGARMFDLSPGPTIYAMEER